MPVLFLVMRLDQAIATRFPGISRRKARELLSQHRVLVNERPVSVASREVEPNDRIAMVDAETELPAIQTTDAWIAVDKPAGLAVQPDRERARRSVEELLRVQLKRHNTPHELYVVHRLDTGTSGVVLFARTQPAAASLSRLFAEGEMRKTYIALVEGTIPDAITIETPIRDKSAITHVRPIRRSEHGTLVEIEIETGRTHQIRIHLSSIGHPVAGDRRYGSTINMPRLMLHAWKLEHPTVGALESAIPPEFV